MRLRLTPQADADLADIAVYLEPRSPQGARRVEAAIQEAFALLVRFPEAGHQRRHEVRRFALPRYPYLIFYRVDAISTGATTWATQSRCCPCAMPPVWKRTRPIHAASNAGFSSEPADRFPEPVE